MISRHVAAPPLVDKEGVRELPKIGGTNWSSAHCIN
jgi:hypothetical protein